MCRSISIEFFACGAIHGDQDDDFPTPCLKTFASNRYRSFYTLNVPFLMAGFSAPRCFGKLRLSMFQLLSQISQQLWEATKDAQFDVVCGVPYTALP
jgi:hypothetical protein